MHRTLIAAAALFCACAPISNAQNPSSPGAWYAYSATFSSPDSRVSLGINGEVRYFDLGRDLEQALIGGIVAVGLPDNSTKLGAGYYLLLSDLPRGRDGFAREHRLYQEASLQQRVLRVDVSHRFRIEERFAEGADFRSRYRYRVGLTLPLTSGQIRTGSVYLVGTNEILLRGAGRNGGPVFDHDRLAGLVGYRVASSLDIQAGYLAQIYESGTDGQVQVAVRQRIRI